MYKAAVFLIAFLTVTAAAQEHEPRDTRHTTEHETTQQQAPWQFWIRGNGQFYDNFFQAPEGAPQDDVTAVLGEVGASFGLSRSLRAYGSVNYLKYDDDALDSSTGIRAGVKMDGQPHAFDVYVEQLNDRPTFDVGDEFDRADIRTLVADYSYRFLHDWQVGVDGELQEQQFQITDSRDNDFHSLGGSVRWRGSRIFSPEIGLRVGERDVEDDVLSYDQRDAYLQIRSALTPKLYLSGRFRDRHRDYGNSGREDKRRQLTVTADYTLVPSLVLNLYGSREKADTNLANRDFTTSMWLVGLTWRF